MIFFCFISDNINFMKVNVFNIEWFEVNCYIDNFFVVFVIIYMY